MKLIKIKGCRKFKINKINQLNNLSVKLYLILIKYSHRAKRNRRKLRKLKSQLQKEKLNKKKNQSKKKRMKKINKANFNQTNNSIPTWWCQVNTCLVTPLNLFLTNKHLSIIIWCFSINKIFHRHKILTRKKIKKMDYSNLKLLTKIHNRRKRGLKIKLLSINNNSNSI